MSEKQEATAANRMAVADTTSLSEFVDDHQRIISVLGVFTALTVFAQQLPIKPLADVLSFLFLAATVALWLELHDRFPNNPVSRKFLLFKESVGWAVLALVFYWLVMYRGFWRQALVTILFFVLWNWLRSRLHSQGWFNALLLADSFWKRSVCRIVYYGLQGAIGVACLVAAALVSTPVNRWLDSVRTSLERDTASTMTSPVNPRLRHADTLPPDVP